MDYDLKFVNELGKKNLSVAGVGLEPTTDGL